MWKRIRLAIILTLGAACVALMVWKFTGLETWMKIDTCLDRGGSWHYDIKECSFTENYRGPR